MKGFKSLLLFCAVIILSNNVWAQQNRFKNERRIYLWDVTLSMKGYQGRTPDIYDKVITALEKDIIQSLMNKQKYGYYLFRQVLLKNGM